LRTTNHPFHFALVAEGVTSRQAWLAKARHAEDLGYSTLLVPDHMTKVSHSETIADGKEGLIDPIVGLMAVADATSLHIGSHVFCNDFRHPIILAQQAANLDLFSEGRLRFGFGCGYLAEEYEQVGIALDSPGVRISRFEEALQIIKAYFRGEQVTFSGQYYQVKGLQTSIKVVQKPHPPIYIGGGGKRILSIAAREADIVGLVAKNSATGLDWTSALLAANIDKIGWVHQAAGERFSQLEFSATIFIAAVTDHPQQAARRIGSGLGLTVEQTLDCLHILVGSVDQIVEELQKRRELLGISCIEVLDTHMETLAPVVARLAGK
jgi:probable F420-dependent oxidoreductase